LAFPSICEAINDLGTREKGMENCKNRSKEKNCFIEIEL
jgi:hypothetical protein